MFYSCLSGFSTIGKNALMLCLACFILPAGFARAQHLSYARNYVFASKVNVRQEPSSKGKIVGRVKPGEAVKFCENGEASRQSHKEWCAVLFNGRTGFISKTMLADGICKSQVDANITFLLRVNAKQEAEFKVLRGDSVVFYNKIKRKKRVCVESMGSLGVTYNSGGKEIIAVYFSDEYYELYEWDGNQIVASKVKLNDDSFITNRYARQDTGFVNADMVNLRSAPSSSGAVVAIVKLYTRLLVLQTDTGNETINGNWGTWHKVKWKGTEAYIWHEYMDVPVSYIKSNNKPNECFMLGNWALYALRSGSIICRQPITHVWNSSGTRIHDFGTRGLNWSNRLIGVCIMAHECGAYGGDIMYSWDGTKFKYFESDGGIGDGGLSEVYASVFPADVGGKKDRVVRYIISSELDDSMEGECRCNDFAVKSERIMECELREDTLIEVSSIHSRARKFVAEHFRKYDLQHFTACDLNGDGVEDIVFLLKDSLNPYDEKRNPIVGVALGRLDGGFEAPLVNKAIVAKKYFAVKFEVKETIIDVEVKYGLGYDASESARELNEFSFEFDKVSNGLIWKSKATAMGEQWGNYQKEYFVTKRIPFEKAWRVPALVEY